MSFDYVKSHSNAVANGDCKRLWLWLWIQCRQI